jgi:hypothetical protein
VPQGLLFWFLVAAERVDTWASGSIEITKDRQNMYEELKITFQAKPSIFRAPGANGELEK